MTSCYSCGSPIVENKDIGLCASCSAEHRKAERMASKVKLVTPIKKVSSKMAGDLKLYHKKRKKFLEFRLLCEARLPGCTQTVSDVHHTKGRGQYLNDVSTWMAVCRHCHDYIHSHHVLLNIANHGQKHA